MKIFKIYVKTFLEKFTKKNLSVHSQNNPTASSHIFKEEKIPSQYHLDKNV